MTKWAADYWKEFKVGSRVRQHDWLLPRGYRDGVVVELRSMVQGTHHRWLYVQFPGHITGKPVVFQMSTAQLELLP